jgi:hypothetical protein
MRKRYTGLTMTGNMGDVSQTAVRLRRTTLSSLVRDFFNCSHASCYSEPSIGTCMRMLILATGVESQVM